MSSQIPADQKSPANSGTGQSVGAAKGVADAVKSATRSAKARRPMSVPVRRLETTHIPGYHLHWIKEQNLPQAYQAAYVHVTEDEVEINTRNVGVSTIQGATSDLSNRVSVQYGGDTLFLMKLEESYYQEDMAALGQRNAEIWQQIFRGEQIAGAVQNNPGDTSNAYVKEAKASGSDLARAALRSNKPLFQRSYKESK